MTQAGPTTTAPHNIGVFLSGTCVLVAVVAPAIVGETEGYPLVLVCLLLVVFNRIWVNRVFFSKASTQTNKELVHGLMTTVVLGLPLLGVITRGLST